MKLFSELYKKIEKLNFNQLFNYFSFSIVFRHKDFVVYRKEANYFLVFINEKTQFIECVNLSTFETIEKPYLFIQGSLTLELLNLEKDLEQIPFEKEFSLATPRSLDFCAALFYQNVLIDHSKLKPLPILEILRSPLFSDQVSVHHKTGLFSLPMFSNKTRNVVNFCDFKDGYYSFRNENIFSFWADPSCFSDEQTMDEKELVLSVNPLSIIESSLYMIGGPDKNFGYCLLQTPIDLDKVLKITSILDLLKYRRIIFCYSPNSGTIQEEIYNILMFYLHFININDKKFVFSHSKDNSGKCNVYLTNTPNDFSFVDFDDIIMILNKQVKEKFCSNPSLSDSEIYQNYNTIDPFIFNGSSVQLPGKNRIYCINFSFMPDLTFILLDYLKEKFSLNLDYLSVSGNVLFNDKQE